MSNQGRNKFERFMDVLGAVYRFQPLEQPGSSFADQVMRTVRSGQEPERGLLASLEALRGPRRVAVLSFAFAFLVGVSVLRTSSEDALFLDMESGGESGSLIDALFYLP